MGCITVLKGTVADRGCHWSCRISGDSPIIMLFMQREPVLLTLGAVVSGTTAFILIQVIKENSKLKAGRDTCSSFIFIFWGWHGTKKAIFRATVLIKTLLSQGFQAISSDRLLTL